MHKKKEKSSQLLAFLFNKNENVCDVHNQLHSFKHMLRVGIAIVRLEWAEKNSFLENYWDEHFVECFGKFMLQFLCFWVVTVLSQK